MLSGNGGTKFKGLSLTDVLPLSVGIEVRNTALSTIAPKQASAVCVCVFVCVSACSCDYVATFCAVQKQ